MPTFDLQLEEPCTCCCVADYGGRTQIKHCTEAAAGFGCQRNQQCAVDEHWEIERWAERVKRKVVSRVTHRHLSAFCHKCDGHGVVPTDFGREVLAFVARHLPKAGA